jgi:hypothetical protein
MGPFIIAEQLSSLHDGYLDAILIDRDQETVTLQCQTLGGRSVRFKVTGVLDCCANNLRLGNIILGVAIFPDIQQFGRQVLEDLAQCDRPEAIDDFVLWMRDKTSGQPKGLLLTSSYGCRLAIVFTGDVQPVDEPSA